MKTRKLFFLVVLGVFALSGVMAAQDFKNLSLLGNYGKGEGESKGVFAAGSLVYYGLGNKVQIASFSNPAAPVKVGSVVVSDVVEDLVRTSINGNQYIVASGGTKMWIIDVKSPTAPSLVASVDAAPGTTAEGVATSGTYAYVAGGGAGLKIYNISAPSNPTLVASVDSLAYCESVVISGQYAYVAAGSRSHILDITNPAAPVYIGRINGYGGYHQYVNVRAGYAYVCNYDASLAVVNVNNPANPVNVVEIPSGYRTARIVFDGNYGYVAVGDSGMSVYNLSNPASPTLVSKIKTIGRATSLYYGAVSIGGAPTGHIFVANRNPAPGVSAINVSNVAAPVTSSFLAALAAPSGTAYTPYYLNNKVYVAYGTAGLRIVDVTTPGNPVLLSTTDLGGDSRAVVVSGNYAYIAARDSGVFVVDVSNPASPVKLQTLMTARARGIALSGTKLYVAASDSGMAYIDISNPAKPKLASYTGSSVYGENVAVNGNIAGLTDYGKITFYDVTNPAAPVKKGVTGAFTTGNEGFAIDGQYAYVPDGDSLKIFSIADMMNPALLSKIKTGGYGYNCAISGKYCYVASEGTGVRGINISNPASPVEECYYDGVPQSRGVAADSKYAYVAEKGDGLSVYSNDLITAVKNENGTIPEKLTLNQNYPNPFNPSTIISVELREKSRVVLEVFNTLGQKVASVFNGMLNSGVTNFNFDGSKLSTGVYMYRLQSGGITISKKMMLIK